MAVDHAFARWSRQVGQRSLHLLLPVVGFWVSTALFGLADYGQGLERTAALLVAAVGLLVLPRQSMRVGAAGIVLLALLTIVLVGFRSHQAQTAVAEDRVPSIDIGTTTIAAVQLVREGRNPYVERIDASGEQVRPGGTGLSHFAGYKYGPVMTWAYLPGVHGDNSSGYFTISLLGLLLLAGAAGAWAYQSAGSAAGVGATCLTLSAAFLDGELFVAGVNDVVPTALVVLAFAARSRGLDVAAGVLLGLSFGAKLLPAALLAFPLVVAARSGRRRVAIGAIVTSLAVYVPVLVHAPQEVLANLVLFNLGRPGDGTALLDGLPTQLAPVVKLLGYGLIAVAVASVARLGRHGRGQRAVQADVAALVAVAVALFFATSTVLHRNYLFWVLPFLAVALAAKAWGDPEDAASEDEVPVHEQHRQQTEARG